MINFATGGVLESESSGWVVTKRVGNSSSDEEIDVQLSSESWKEA